MGKKSKAGGAKKQGQGNVTNGGKQIVPQSTDAKKTKSINVFQGILPPDLAQVSMDQTPT